MKLLILTAIIAAVASSPVVQGPTWPWKVGKVYRYDVSSYTSTRAHGNTITAELIVSVKAPGHLQAKLENPLYTVSNSFEESLEPQPQPILNMNETFDIFVDGGRVVSINFPKSLSVTNENLIKAFITALQVDVSSYGNVEDYPNSYDHEHFQGQFKKMEFDLAGECETLYTISPESVGWRLRVPEVTIEEDPIAIVKSKNYGSCKKYLGYSFGVPEGAVFKGFPQSYDEKEFIRQTSNTYTLVGKTGTIYKSQVQHSVFASPVIYGKQKHSVHSAVGVYLKSVEEDNTAKWEKLKEYRSVDSLLFTIDNSWRLFTYGGEGNIAKAQQLLQEISPMLQNPNRLEKDDFLIKFNVLVYMLISMNSEQLAQMTSSMEIARTSKNPEKNGMWVVYRDAVAQCGTTRAFNEIKSWVLTKKIEGDEAAQVVTAIGSTLGNPNKAVLTDFFNLAMNPEVLEQKSLNNSALLAVSRLIRFSKDDQFVIDTIVPRFTKELNQAIVNNDSVKAQVYIIALGNVARPAILQAFAPFLEGQVSGHVTKYLRTLMVTSLKTLANSKCKYTRSVLYSIIKNTAEPYDVRVAAALNIFLTFPTPEMMEVMAFMTHNDPSTQVRAVLANSITLAAGLKDPRFAELAKTAKSVLYLMPEEKYGYSYSTDSLVDGYTGDEDFSFFKELSYIGSENTLLPKYHRAALRFKGTAVENERTVTMSISDLQNMINTISKALFKKSNDNDSTFKFSAKQIIDMLKIKFAESEPIEGALFTEIFNQQKLFTFDKASLFEFISNLLDNMGDMKNGVQYHFTKIFRQNLVNVDFPLASGMPFTFQYSEPTIINAHTETKFKFDEDAKGGFLDTKINVTYARNIIGTVGFMDTVGGVLTSAGLINKLQVYIPTNIKTTYKIGGDVSVQIEPMEADNDINLVHISVLPYAGTQKKDSLTYNLHVIKGSAKDLVSTDVNFGYWTGMNYNLKGESYSADYKNFAKLFSTDLLTSLGNLLYQKNIAYTNYDFKYLSKLSTAKSVKFTMFFDKLYNQKYGGEMGPATDTEHVEPNSEPRRQEMIKKVSAGIEAAEVTLVDISAVFDGSKKEEFVFTAACANSFVDPKVQAIFFARNQDQYNAVFKLNKEGAKTVPLNFEEALKNKFRVSYDAEIKFGDYEHIKMEGYGKRTDQYTEMLKNDSTGSMCLYNTDHKNFYQKNCHEMNIKAHAPDYFKSTVTYSGREMIFLRVLGATYEYLKDEYSLEDDINPFVKTDGNKLEIEAQAFYLDNYYNYNVTSKFGLLTLNNVKGNWHDPYIMAIYGPINTWERARNCYTGYQYMPYCAVDDNVVRTFSDRNYDYKLTSSWHVVMVDSVSSDNLVILARRPKDNEEEVYVSYRSETGKHVEIDIKPNNVEVKSDALKTSEGAYTLYWDNTEDNEVPLLEYYTLAEGVQVFNLRDRHLRVVYDKHRLVIFTNEHRSTTRGMCGQSSGQTIDDYITPFGFVSQPEYYGPSFSLEGEFSDPKTVELKKEAMDKVVQPVTIYTKILPIDAEWSKVLNKTVKSTVV